MPPKAANDVSASGNDGMMAATVLPYDDIKDKDYSETSQTSDHTVAFVLVGDCGGI